MADNETWTPAQGLHISWRGDYFMLTMDGIKIYGTKLSGRNPKSLLPQATAALASYLERVVADRMDKS